MIAYGDQRGSRDDAKPWVERAVSALFMRAFPSDAATLMRPPSLSESRLASCRHRGLAARVQLPARRGRRAASRTPCRDGAWQPARRLCPNTLRPGARCSLTAASALRARRSSARWCRLRGGLPTRCIEVWSGLRVWRLRVSGALPTRCIGRSRGSPDSGLGALDASAGVVGSAIVHSLLHLDVARARESRVPPAVPVCTAGSARIAPRVLRATVRAAGAGWLSRPALCLAARFAPRGPRRCTGRELEAVPRPVPIASAGLPPHARGARRSAPSWRQRRRRPARPATLGS